MNPAFVLPDAWRTVRLVLIRPPGMIHASAVAEVMESLMYGFRALGILADMAENEIKADAINIVFLSFYLSEQDVQKLPPNSIIYNFEQVGADAVILNNPSFMTALGGHCVWDYSFRNIERLRPLIMHDRLQLVPVGYVPALTRIPHAPVQDIDVLFYGSGTERRRIILTGLRQTGIHLANVFGAYGPARDALIARAKVVLNIHSYETKIMEVVRISYLLANRKAIVSELDLDTEMEPDLRDAVAGVPFDGLIAECHRLIADAAARQQLEDRGYGLFQKRDLIPILRQAIAEAADPPDQAG
ncbi:MAG: hypothetical protein WCC64_16030 [Aliidongia sp.]